MKNPPNPCADSAVTSRPRDCLPCDLPPFCRNHYFTGKLLTERDFVTEQRYGIDKLRLHHLALHGCGVVCGLKVIPHPRCPERRIIVEPGWAIDCCGREIRLPQCVDIELPWDVAPPPPEEPCPAEPDQSPSQEEAPPRTSRDADEECADPPPSRQYADPPPEHEHPAEPEPCPPGQPGIPLYLCLRYAECETEFMPAPFDECSCDGTTQKPNRICETFKLELVTDKPGGWDAWTSHPCEPDDCWALYDTISDPCPEPHAACVPLAVISDYVPRQPVTAPMIDNKTCRPLLPSTRLLDQLVRCILEKLPPRAPTRISDTNWIHGHEYHCHEFLRMFGGGFEVTFDGKVRAEGLSARSFQATVVRHGGKKAGGSVEIAPAKVSTETTSSGHTKFVLQLDPTYVQRHLDGTNFDLFVTLRCNLIVDAQGMPVDGNLLATWDSDTGYGVVFPTGDGISGGTFESWIKVRTHVATAD